MPQPPQNLAAGSFSKPQFAQATANGAPHCTQKRLLIATFSAMQLGQRIGGTSRRLSIRTLMSPDVNDLPGDRMNTHNNARLNA
jgi:hypothetical protein